MAKRQIDLKLSKNWKHFINWHIATNGTSTWEEQKRKIKTIFNATAPHIINWNSLWEELEEWIASKDDMPNWSAQKRQIETIMLGQLRDLDKEIFTLGYLYHGIPTIQHDKFSYWEAISLKDKMQCNGDGIGGMDHVEKVKVINLKRLIG